ncbi:hypothetical protein ACA910_000615 [Epithemia clementina (nom. ined.)]
MLTRLPHPFESSTQPDLPTADYTPINFPATLDMTFNLPTSPLKKWALIAKQQQPPNPVDFPSLQDFISALHPSSNNASGGGNKGQCHSL